MHVCLLSWMPCLSMLAQNYSDTKLLRLLRKEAERLLLSQAWKNVPKKGRTTSRMLAMHHLVDTRDYFIACRRRSTHSDLKKEFNFIPTRKLCIAAVDVESVYEKNRTRTVLVRNCLIYYHITRYFWAMLIETLLKGHSTKNPTAKNSKRFRVPDRIKNIKTEVLVT